jgi:hypothetical protein
MNADKTLGLMLMVGADTVMEMVAGLEVPLPLLAV